MYWLRGKFIIASRADLVLLERIYKDVGGELTFSAGATVITIKWQDNPFQALIEELGASDRAGEILCRLCGPDTVRAVTQRPERLSPEELDEVEERENILTWAKFIDKVVSNEMDRGNDMGVLYKRPTPALTSMAALHLAIRVSQFGTHVIPTANGFIVTNADSTYLSYITLDSTPDEKYDSCSVSLMFDKDDGFCSCFSEGSLPGLAAPFAQWKDANYEGDLSSHYPHF